MTGIRGVLLDLDGVLYVGNDLLPGAREALARLRERRLPVQFVTNSTRRPRRAIQAGLSAMGLNLGDDELVTPARAACTWLGERRLSPHLLIHPDLREDFNGLSSPDAEEPVDRPANRAVVVGDAGEGFTYEALNRAFRLLMEGAPFLALAKNRYFREVDGLSLDAGPFVAALEFAGGVTAEVVGKPAPGFFHAAVTALGCEPAEAVMVGDDVEADVGGAIAAGLQGILVETGKFRVEDRARLHRHGVLVRDIGAAIDRILAAA
ncbi:TIGR01458 family HAD-type hydrolase [Rhodospirillaceae bacterium SYSU D60014]|uniref:TIGR01458 family HAD-type hydrolase n=1 Tax=Virgifigura deserti TaxID=2268457 RepID=UPI000E673B5C